MLYESEIDKTRIASKLKQLLLAVHTPKVDFQLRFTTRCYPKRLGTYYPNRYLIYVHGGCGGFNAWLEVAIHEYAHHIHHTEVNSSVGDTKVHGETFNFIYQSLLATANRLQLFQRSSIFR